MRRWLGFVCVLALSACATQVPPGIRDAPASSPALAEVRANPGAHQGAVVRWGGEIARVQNLEQDTRIEIVEHRLQSGGRPVEDDASGGRFIALVHGFLDPAIYAPERQITVHGTLTEPVSGQVGEHPYRYPVVEVQTVYLWEELMDYPDSRWGWSLGYGHYPWYYRFGGWPYGW